MIAKFASSGPEGGLLSLTGTTLRQSRRNKNFYLMKRLCWNYHGAFIIIFFFSLFFLFTESWFEEMHI